MGKRERGQACPLGGTASHVVVHCTVLMALGHQLTLLPLHSVDGVVTTLHSRRAVEAGSTAHDGLCAD